MREIKFRGKAIYDGQWVYGLLRKRLGINHGIIEAESGLGSDVDLDTVGEFTGQWDKDQNNMIYEEDIVSLWGAIYIVRFVAAGFWFVATENPKLPDIEPTPNNCKDVRVIGNIYDNPELLK